MSTKTRFALAAIVMLLTALTGCGGGSKGLSSNPSTPPPTTVTLSSITVSPSAPSVVVGNAQQLTATALYSDASSKDVTALVSWSTSDASVATVNNSGMAMTKAQGSATITATMNSKSGPPN